ncbi:hypothetical protein T439DRAFT_327687 [Meredithblackwellia eburnea MCA 4105]
MSDRKRYDKDSFHSRVHQLYYDASGSRASRGGVSSPGRVTDPYAQSTPSDQWSTKSTSTGSHGYHAPSKEPGFIESSEKYLKNNEDYLSSQALAREAKAQDGFYKRNNVTSNPSQSMSHVYDPGNAASFKHDFKFQPPRRETTDPKMDRWSTPHNLAKSHHQHHRQQSPGVQVFKSQQARVVARNRGNDYQEGY